MATAEVNHSERYKALTQEDKDKIEAILSFLDGKNLADVKRLLGIASRELDVRGFLSLK
jgi:hypothetical protein